MLSLNIWALFGIQGIKDLFFPCTNSMGQLSCTQIVGEGQTYTEVMDLKCVEHYMRSFSSQFRQGGALTLRPVKVSVHGTLLGHRGRWSKAKGLSSLHGAGPFSQQRLKVMRLGALKSWLLCVPDTLEISSPGLQCYRLLRLVG